MKKLVCAMASALLIAGLFAGCGNGDVSSSSTPGDMSSSANPTSSESPASEWADDVSEAVSELIPPIVNSAASDIASALDPNAPQSGASSAASASSMQ